MVFENIKHSNAPFHFKCILILGATASGKTNFAHQLADELKIKNINCELVNLDAFQIYKGLDIGTAKPSKEEIAKYHYHGIDTCELNENYDANTFARKSWEYCHEIYARNSIPICVGGSGLYLRAFLHGLDELPMRDEKVRAQIQETAKTNGWPYCHEWLKQVDAKRALELHPNDKTRIERALEIFLTTGKPQSENRSKEKILKEQMTLFPCYVIHCKPNVTQLKERIQKRVEVLFNFGWQEEVQHLFSQHGDKLLEFHSMKAIGYKEILISLQNQTPKQELLQKISTLTWHYAKKQRTWCAKEKTDLEIETTDSSYLNEIFSFLEKNSSKNF